VPEPDDREPDDREPDDDDYRRLLELRTGLRQFLHWSEQRATEVGITPAQHQMMLAIRGHGGADGPTIGDLAEALLLRHHSAVGLVDRGVTAGLVERDVDASDHRLVRLRLTARGARKLRRLSGVHLEELRRLAPRMRSLWANLDVDLDRGVDLDRSVKSRLPQR
jgi:DNA-binding MarR family transcriptional regulator